MNNSAKPEVSIYTLSSDFKANVFTNPNNPSEEEKTNLFSQCEYKVPLRGKPREFWTNEKGNTHTEIVGEGFLEYVLFKTKGIWIVIRVGSTIAGFAKMSLKKNKVVYLDVICSKKSQGMLLMDTVLMIAKTIGARLITLSALSHVISFYRDVYGFTRVPDQCNIAKNITKHILPLKTVLKNKARLEGTHKFFNQYKPNFETYLKVGAHENKLTEGFYMSKCLAEAKGRQVWGLPMVDWSKAVPKIAEVKLTGLTRSDINSSRIVRHYAVPKKVVKPPATFFQTMYKTVRAVINDLDDRKRPRSMSTKTKTAKKVHA